jgi:acyl-CoA thioesterase-1
MQRVTGVFSEGEIPQHLFGLIPIITLPIRSKMAHMKKQSFTGLFVGLFLVAGSLVGSAQVTIMPFGDSVTSRGGTPESSYRYWLWKDLTDAGFSFDFIGNASGVSDGPPANDWPDQEYEGEEGLSAGAALSDYEADAVGRSPDVVLIDLGSNDFNPDLDVKSNLDQVRNNLDAIIQGFIDARPDTIILLAKPTPWVTADKAERKFMSGLGGAVNKAAQDEKRNGAHVIVVNLHGGFSARKDTKDGTHPNVRGEQKIANKYFQALKRVL